MFVLCSCPCVKNTIITNRAISFLIFLVLCNTAKLWSITFVYKSDASLTYRCHVWALLYAFLLAVRVPLLASQLRCDRSQQSCDAMPLHLHLLAVPCRAPLGQEGARRGTKVKVKGVVAPSPKVWGTARATKKSNLFVAMLRTSICAPLLTCRKS